MAKSKGRLLAELLASDGKVKESKSALDIAGGKLAASDIPILPNSKLENSSISIAGHSTSLGESVSLNTGDITEHTNFKYYTDTRVRSAISASGDIAYNSTTGVISFSQAAGAVVSVNGTTGSVVLDTGDIAENGNLYHTTARARAAISATGSLAYNSTTGVMSFTMPAQNTSNITEGSNLYYTNARADARIVNAGSANWNTAYGWGNHASAGYLTSSSTQSKYLRSDVADSGGTTTGSSLNIPYLKTNMLLVDATNFADTVNGAPWYGLGKSTLVGYHSNNSTMSQLANYWGLRLQTQGARIDMTPTGYAANILFGSGTDVSGTTWARINSTGLYQGLSNLVWHAGNDGSGSGLDADLLDGINSTSFLRSDATDTATGALTFTSTANHYHGHHYFDAWDSNGNHYPHYLSGSSNNGAQVNLRVQQSGGSGYDVLYIPNGSNNITWRGNNVWNAGNDGSGSGLDADTLDGLDLHTGRNNEVNKIVRTDSNGYIQAGWINTTSGALTTQAIDRVYASTDNYIRYYTAANFGAGISSHINYNNIANKPTITTLSNGANNRIVTATGTSSLDAEANLQYDGSALDIYTAGNAVTDNHVGLTFRLTGTYSDGRYEHRFRKRDEGGGIPLYIDKTDSTANAHTAIARFGSYTSNTEEFEVYGAAKVSGNLTVTGIANITGGVTCSTVNTGQGATEVHLMNQNVRSTDNVIFNRVTVDPASGGANFSLDRSSTSVHNNLLFYTGSSLYWRLWQSGANNSLAIRNEATTTNVLSFTDNESTFSHNINAPSLNTGHGDNELYPMNQAVRTSDSPTFQDLTVQGNLSITGDINSYNVTDLDVTDKTITVGSGQTEANSGGSGLIVDGSLASILWDEGNDEWDFNKKANFAVTPKVGTATILTDNAGLNANNITSGTLATARLSSHLDVGGRIDFNVGTNYGTTTSPDRLWSSSFNTGQSDVPGNYYDILNLSTSASHGIQIASHYGGGQTQVYIRTRSDNGSAPSGAGLQPWALIWTDRTDGAGSGLDADTLDGIDSGSFLRSDADDSFTGNISTTSTNGIRFGSSNQTDTNDGYIAAGRFGAGLNIVGTQTSSGTGRQVRIWGDVETDGGNKFWNAGNDGSGSGLDADLLDGQHGSYYYAASNPNGYTNDQTPAEILAALKTVDVNGTAGVNAGTLDGIASSRIIYGANASGTGEGTFSDWNAVTKSGFYSHSGASNKWSTANWSSILHTKLYNSNNNYATQLGFDTYNNNLYTRTNNNGTWTSWDKIWHAGVDGSGSGLDADLLDGQHGSYYYSSANPPPTDSQYLRSDTLDVMTYNTTTGEMLKFANNTSGGKIQLGFQQNDTDGMHHRAYLKFWKGSTSASGNVDLIVRGTGGSLTSDVLSLRSGNASPTWRGQTIWNAGNDGSGSGLDADLLDGQQGSYYYSSANPPPTYAKYLRSDANDTATGTLDLNGRVNIGNSVARPTSLNSDSVAQARIGGSDVYLYVASLGSGGGYKVAVQAARASDFLSFTLNLQSNGGELQRAGNKVWDAGNDGSGTGLDADLLDGIQGASFLRSDAGDTATGSIVFSGASQYFRRNDTTNYTNAPLLVESYGGASTTTGIGFHISGQLGRYLRMNSSGVLAWEGSTLWHAGNDGSGSGLDADLLDGQHGSYYRPASQATTLTGAVTGSGTTSISTSNPYQTSVTFQGSNGNSPDSSMEYTQAASVSDSRLAPSTDWYNKIRMGHGDPYNYYGNTIAVKMTGTGYGDLYTMTVSNNSTGNWNKHWHANNDGSGTGLDADLLDGQHGSYYYAASNPNGYTNDQTAAEILAALKTVDVNGTAGVNAGTFDGVVSTSFLRSDTSDTMNGELNVTRNGGITGSSAPTYSQVNIEVQTSSNHVPGIGFHRGGYSATTLYEYDGELYTNAWISKAQTGKLVSSGNIASYAWTSSNDGSGSGLDADLLDGQHGSYYTNPTSLPANGGNSDTVDNMHFHTQLGVGEKIDFTVGGDAATYYPVVITGGGNARVTDFQIFRGYGETAPSSWGSSTHMGGLTFNYKIMGAAGWGGYPTGIRVQEFGEVYRRILGGIAFTAHSMKHVVWLRGGTATYHIWSNADISIEVNDSTSAANYVSASPHKWYSYDHSNAAYDVTVSERTSAEANSGVANEVYLNMPVSYNSAGTPAVYGIATSAYNHKFWNSSNDGSGSGLDADTLDGIDSGSFLRSDTSDSFTSGTLTFSTAAVLDLATQDSYASMRVIRNNKASSDGIYLGYLNTNSGSTRIFGGGQGSGGIYVTGSGVNDIKYNNASTFWHAGNDGSGTGLDADLLDGQHATSFIQQGTNAVGNGSFSDTIGAGFRFQRVTGGSNRAYTSHHNLLQIPNTSGDQYLAQMAFGTGDTKLAWRSKGASFGSWFDIWHSGNDGSGSGLDADLLDGGQGSDYARKGNVGYQQGSDLFTFPSFNDGNSTSGDQSSIQIYNGNAQEDAFIAFHISGDYAGYFGLDGTTNDLFWGGWSVGNNKHKIWHAGNDGTGSGLDADLLDGLNAKGVGSATGASQVLTSNTNNYFVHKSWIDVGTSGLYSTTTNGSHFRPNNVTSYGSWASSGSRGGYDGIVFDSGGDAALMFDSGGNGGMYAQSYVGWMTYFHQGNDCLGVCDSTTSSSYGLYLSGAFYATGNITAYSDRRVKENIVQIDSALEKVNKLEGVYYNRTDDESKTKEIGFIAQDVNEVVPELVTYAEDVDQYGVKYQNATALLVEAVKELTQQVNDLKQEIEEIKNVK